ncbi:MAG TPA: hypothetical protein VIV40_10380, partial [Kofleriaceae bacterium]
IGSRTQIPPVPPTPPAIAPLRVRFAPAPTTTPSPPARMAAGTTSPEATEVKRDEVWQRQARDAFIRGVVYALLIVIVAAVIYALY